MNTGYGKLNLKYDQTDHDNRRIYYTSEKGSLYCFQFDTDMGEKVFLFFSCTEQGEPSYQVGKTNIESAEYPPCNEKIQRELVQFAGYVNWVTK